MFYLESPYLPNKGDLHTYLRSCIPVESIDAVMELDNDLCVVVLIGGKELILKAKYDSVVDAYKRGLEEYEKDTE